MTTLSLKRSTLVCQVTSVGLAAVLAGCSGDVPNSRQSGSTPGTGGSDQPGLGQTGGAPAGSSGATGGPGEGGSLAAGGSSGSASGTPSVGTGGAGQSGASGQSGGVGNATGGAGGTPDVVFNPPPFKPAPGALRRLTRAQFKNAVFDVFGVTVDVEGIDDDSWSGNFAVIGAASVVTSEVGVEQYQTVLETAIKTRNVALAEWAPLLLVSGLALIWTSW